MTAGATTDVEVVVLGRLGVDLYPKQARVPLSEQREFVRFVGGFAGNVSTGLARLGRRVAIGSRVGQDGHGTFVRRFLSAEGVDLRYLEDDHDWPTPLTFCEIWPPDDFPITYYRKPTVPDWQLRFTNEQVEEISAAPLLFATGTGLAQFPSRATTVNAMRSHRGITVLDLDWRPSLWSDRREFERRVATAVTAADVVLGNESELEASGLTPDAAFAAGPTVVVVKRGGRGVTVVEPTGRSEIPGIEVEIVNGLGAGDAFAAAFGDALLAGAEAAEAARVGNLAGALVASRLACSEAMPNAEELAAAPTSEARG